MVPLSTRPGRRGRLHGVRKLQTQTASVPLHTPGSQPSPRSYQVDDGLVSHDLHTAGEAVCGKCRAVYHGKRWSYPAKPPLRFKQLPRVECPGCRLEREGKVGGIVRLSGDFFPVHEENILSQIRRIAMRERQRNPLARLLKLERNGQGLSVFTTHRTLAVLLGKELHHANHGSLKIHWTDHDPLRVEWSRT
ncbi:MAG: BCAM0308 family protein [Terriglobia bacterium]